MPRERPITATIKKDKGAKRSNSKKILHNKKENMHFSVILPFPYGAKKAAAALLEWWIKDDSFHFWELEFLSTT